MDPMSNEPLSAATLTVRGPEIYTDDRTLQMNICQSASPACFFLMSNTGSLEGVKSLCKYLSNGINIIFLNCLRHFERLVDSYFSVIGVNDKYWFPGALIWILK